jgi:hypothetical protein
MTDRYEDALHQAQAELEKLEERRANLLSLIKSLKLLSDDEAYELTPPPGYVPQGLTEEIRTILTLSVAHLDAMQIRDALILRGFKHTSPRNLLINVHTVLGRIKNELDVVHRGGKPLFLRKPALDRTLAEMAELLNKNAGLPTPSSPKPTESKK